MARISAATGTHCSDPTQWRGPVGRRGRAACSSDRGRTPASRRPRQTRRSGTESENRNEQKGDYFMVNENSILFSFFFVLSRVQTWSVFVNLSISSRVHIPTQISFRVSKSCLLDQKTGL